jgi:adenylate cyclase
MAHEIRRQGGTVDNFMDGRMLAFWNAPLRVDGHAAVACHTALAMRRALPTLNRELAELLGAGDGVLPLEMAVAIDTGLCAVGQIGSALWSDYTAVGFPVRRAGLLEQRARLAGKNILVTDSVVDAVAGFAFSEVRLDFPRLRGGGPEMGYELLATSARMGGAS